MVPSTRHYSWPKAGTLLGIGQQNVLSIHVDLQARMEVNHLIETLQTCLRKHTPVIAVVAVIGSTEESAVDPLRKILDVRDEFREQGLDFAIHCDAAWGGYFISTLRQDADDTTLAPTAVPTFPMSDYVVEQYHALRETDSITVDPHKAGYIDYPAGALCYRNSATRDLVSLAAPVVLHYQSEPTVGIYGIEGSKPGAAAAAVWLAHKVIPPTQDGYGKILGQCMWTSKRMYARFVTMDATRFRLVPFQMLPAELDNLPPEQVQKQLSYIRQHFVQTNDDDLEDLLNRDEYARNLFMSLGSDQVILAYAFNFYDRRGRLNTDAQKMNRLNREIYKLCSMSTPDADMDSVDLILTSSSFTPAGYGQPFVDHYSRRLGVDPVPGGEIDFLISTTMDPWTTEITTEDGKEIDFLNTVESALRDSVNKALNDLGY